MSDDHKFDPECAHCKNLAAGMSEEEAFNARLDDLKSIIERVGVAVIGVGEDRVLGIPAFFYSIGLTALGKPEVILFGLPTKFGMQTINRYFFEVRDGKITSEPQVLNEWFNLPVHVIKVDDEPAHVFGNQAYQFYQRENPALEPEFVQLVFTDRNGVAPWEDGFEAHFVQPVLAVEPLQPVVPRVLH